MLSSACEQRPTVAVGPDPAYRPTDKNAVKSAKFTGTEIMCRPNLVRVSHYRTQPAKLT